MPTIDDLGARAAASLRNQVAAELDVDAGLRAAIGTTPPRRHSVRPYVWGLTAAAAVAAVVAGVLLVDDDSPGVVTPATTVPSATTLAPATTQVPPSSTDATTSTVAVTEPPPSVPVEPDDVIVVDVAPFLVPALLPPCTTGACAMPLISSDGTLIGYDPATASIVITETDGSQQSVPLALTAPIDPDLTSLLAVGPRADVAYLAAAPDGSADPVADLIAVSLRGDNAGRTIATATERLDMSGDSTIVPTPAGLVEVPDLGYGVRPAPDSNVLIPWVDHTGAALPPFGSFTTWDPSTHVATRYTADRTLGTWTVPASVDLSRGMPMVAEIGDGAIAVAGYDWAKGEEAFLRLVPGDTAQKYVLPAGYSVAGFWAGTPVLFDGTTFQQWNLPGYTEPVDATSDWVGRLGSDAFVALADAQTAIAAQLADPGTCDIPSTADFVTHNDGTTADIVVTSTFGCDDSSAGELLTFSFDLTDRWHLTAVDQRTLCSRGLGGLDVCS